MTRSPTRTNSGIRSSPPPLSLAFITSDLCSNRPYGGFDSLKNHIGPVNIVKYNHTHKYCLSGGHDKTIRLWNPASGAQVKVYDLHRQEVLGLDM